MEFELRDWTYEDIDDLIYLCNHADRKYLSNRMPYPYTKEDALWYLDYISKENSLFKAIIVDGRCIGNISIEGMGDVYCKDAEIGYHLLPDYHNQGIMSEATAMICKLAFECLDIVRITGLVYEPNIGSRKVLEKNGFALEGLKKRAIYKDNDYYNLCIYGKCRDE